MNGCRTLFKKQEFEQVKNLQWGYSIRVGRYDMTIDGEEFVSAVEVVRTTTPTEQELVAMEGDALTKEKSAKIGEVLSAAASKDVKQFRWLGKESCWWDSEQRASIRASLEAREDGEVCYLEVNGKIYEMSKEKAVAVVGKIELYASDCHLAVCVAKKEIAEKEAVADVVTYAVEWPLVVEITLGDITVEEVEQ